MMIFCMRLIGIMLCQKHVWIVKLITHSISFRQLKVIKTKGISKGFIDLWEV